MIGEHDAAVPGVRFNCNKCHDHPFERWTQDQYYGWAAFFAQVRLQKDPESGDRTIGGTAVEAAQPLFEIVDDGADGEMIHLRTGKPRRRPRSPSRRTAHRRPPTTATPLAQQAAAVDHLAATTRTSPAATSTASGAT